MTEQEIKILTTFSPSAEDIDFLTEKINEESRANGVKEDAFPFGIFLKLKGDIIGGCNGSVVYGQIYTDQLWVNNKHRGQGLGRKLMEKVEEIGREKGCKVATVGTMSFQGAQPFYEKIGYSTEFVRDGYANGGQLVYLKKHL